MLNTLKIECPAYLLERAKPLPAVTTAVVNAGTTLIMQSAQSATDQGLINPVLVGDADAIRKRACDIGWDLRDLRIENAESPEQAAQRAVSLARSGEVKSLMKGSVHTDSLLRAVLDKDTGLRTGRRLSV
jgi:phosphate acetyltransferase